MGTTIPIMEDHMINAHISHSIEAMEIDFEMNLSTIRMETGETMEDLLVPRRSKGETFHKIIHTSNQKVIDLTILPSADLTINLLVILRLTNKHFHKTKTRGQLMWLASPQPTISLTNYQASVR